EWRKRLYAIAVSTDSTTISAGICGTCLLQAYQMIAELQEYYPSSPLASGGYFFDTQPNRDPMISFGQRYSDLYTFMLNATALYGAPLTPVETDDEINLRIALAVTQAVLPRFTWNASRVLTHRGEILAAIRNFFRAPVGSVWIAFLTYTFPDGSTGAHAMPIIRSHYGIHVIPTNITDSFDVFSEDTEETMSYEFVYSIFSQQGQATIDSFATLQMGEEDPNPLSVVMSQNNCTGEGSDRRGNRMFPRSSTVNQCLKGRCSIM
ncbi:DUF1561 family protein, partial [Bartonella sp. F02]|uniref:DUF1561 family protein n=1 Tax=Bartonella sp. F02 TaxID=2967262 RepID=UPI0022A8F0B4